MDSPLTQMMANMSDVGQTQQQPMEEHHHHHTSRIPYALFLQHFWPGAMFVWLAGWWLVLTTIRYLQSQYLVKKTSSNQVEPIKFKSSFTMPVVVCPCARCTELPIESIVKIVMGLIGIHIEIIVGVTNNYERNSYIPIDDDNQQHMTMYFLFIIGSLVEIAMFYGAQLPAKCDYAIGIAAFIVEGILFSFHLHTKEPANTYLHVLLVISVVGCVIFTLLEACYVECILFVYGRILFVGMQGIWLVAIGFIVDPIIPGINVNMETLAPVKMFSTYYCWFFVSSPLFFVGFYYIVKMFYFTESTDYHRNLYNQLPYIEAKSKNFKLVYVDEQNELLIAKLKKPNSYPSLNHSDEEACLIHSDHSN